MDNNSKDNNKDPQDLTTDRLKIQYLNNRSTNSACDSNETKRFSSEQLKNRIFQAK